MPRTYVRVELGVPYKVGFLVEIGFIFKFKFINRAIVSLEKIANLHRKKIKTRSIGWREF